MEKKYDQKAAQIENVAYLIEQEILELEKEIPTSDVIAQIESLEERQKRAIRAIHTGEYDEFLEDEKGYEQEYELEEKKDKSPNREVELAVEVEDEVVVEHTIDALPKEEEHVRIEKGASPAQILGNELVSTYEEVNPTFAIKDVAEEKTKSREEILKDLNLPKEPQQDLEKEEDFLPPIGGKRGKYLT